MCGFGTLGLEEYGIYSVRYLKSLNHLHVSDVSLPDFAQGKQIDTFKLLYNREMIYLQNFRVVRSTLLCMYIRHSVSPNSLNLCKPTITLSIK